MLFNTASRSSQQLVFSNETVEVWIDNQTGHHSLLSARAFQQDELFCKFEASAILQSPSYQTIQVGTNKHICLEPLFLQYTNHSCFPNIFFDTTAYKVICLRAIKAGDQLAYFYPSTEWIMAEPFQCHCGMSNCLGYINGASYLSKEVLANYRLSDFIHEQLKKNHKK